MKHIFLLILLLNYFIGEAQQVQLLLEPIVVHTSPLGDGTDLTGKTTYRLYAQLENENDIIDAWGSIFPGRLEIRSTTTFWQSPIGNMYAENVNCSILDIQGLAYDSWITFDCESDCTCNNNHSLFSDFTTTFETDGGPLDVNTIGIISADGIPFPPVIYYTGWAEAGVDHRILLGQFTTDGDITCKLNVHVKPFGLYTTEYPTLNYSVTSDYGIHYTLETATISNASYGCIDPAACNYHPNPQFTETCIYPSCNNPDACNFSDNPICAGECLFPTDNYTCQTALPIFSGDSVIVNKFCIPIEMVDEHPCAPDFHRQVWFSFQYYGGRVQFSHLSNLPNDPSRFVIYNNCTSTVISCKQAIFNTQTQHKEVYFDCSDGLIPGETYYLQITAAQYVFDFLFDNNSGLGCTDESACNFDVCAETSDGSCVYGIAGCMDENACDYDPAATCSVPCLSMPGCTDPMACNYDPNAACESGLCIPYASNFQCEEAVSIIDQYSFIGNFACAPIVTASYPCDSGTDWRTLWYSIEYQGGLLEIQAQSLSKPILYAIHQDCSSEVLVCNMIDDELSFGIDCSSALIPGETYKISISVQGVYSSPIQFFVVQNATGCTNTSAYNFNPCAQIDDGTCQYGIAGCTLPTCCNYLPEAVIDDGSCIWGTCSDETACNYNPSSDCSNLLLCRYSPENTTCISPISITPDEMVLADFSCVVAPSELTNTCDGSYMRELWYQFTYETGGDIAVFIAASARDVAIEVFEDCEGTSIFCDSLGSSQYGHFAVNKEILLSGYELGLIPGENYFLRILNASFGEDAETYFKLRHIIIPGCTDPSACNYSSEYNFSDGSCLYGETGCTDPMAVNYNSSAVCDDGQCITMCEILDFNDDNVVNITDLEMLNDHFGCIGNCGEYDLGGNQVVGTDDIVIFIGNMSGCQ